jgi:hypothetical protein
MKIFSFFVSSGFEMILSARSKEEARLKVIRELDSNEYAEQFKRRAQVSQGKTVKQ